MKNLITLLICSFVVASNLFAQDFISPELKVGNIFTRREGTATIKVSNIITNAELYFSTYSFHIFAKEDPTTKVGFVNVTYCQKQSSKCENEGTVSIDLMEIEPTFRRKGYGETALRIILGIFRSPKRSGLLFNNFELLVGTGANRLAARLLYQKLGFSNSADKFGGYQPMSLAR